MKRRNRVGRRSWSSRQNALSFFSGAAPRKRKTFSFERLEDRYYFSVSQTPLSYQTGSLSSDTTEGAAAIWARELEWAALSVANGANAANAALATYALPTDPLFNFQWHLLNVGQEVGNPDFQRVFGVAGQDINVVGAWNKGYTGAGVTVAVIDTGVQISHPDLAANIHPTLRLNAITGGSDPNPSILDIGSEHGTAVAGLIAARANNGIGGTGVAPGATIVPIRLISQVNPPIFPTSFDAAFQYAANQIDITNNSWGFALDRSAQPLAPSTVQILRDTVRNGRGGLGTIHVFATGNSGGPDFVEGFEGFGAYDSATWNAWINTRFTIGVTMVDHDGLYANFDGSFTSYGETSAATLIAAPSGSNVAQNVADDSGQGSGIFTTDLMGDLGANAAPLPNGFDFDRDFLLDPNYTSRFNGTSAAAPLVSGVIALMLEANPNLTYRDVQEILLRSARQNAQFELPESGGGLFVSETPWRTNQFGLFRNPDPFVPGETIPTEAVYFPLMAPDPFLGRLGHYEAQPAMYATGSGYTVSQGHGVYAEQIGTAHGVVDAGLAVKMAEQWHALGQNMLPNTEKTFTTFVQSFPAGLDIPAAERMDLDFGGLLVPGAIGGEGGFIEYWEEYFADDDPDDPEDGPFSDYDGPSEFGRGTYLSFTVPDNQAINLESVEVRVSISGGTEDLDFLRILLVSPEGTHSELNHYYIDADVETPASLQIDTGAPAIGLPGFGGTIDPDGGNFVWTFRTNRIFGERTSDAVIIDPVTGEPVLQVFEGTPIAALSRNWELHIENWSASDMALNGLEIVWHGKPIAAGTQRIQGFVGVDRDGDENFNYTRFQQFVFDLDNNPLTTRLGDVVRQMDLNQEPFAENILVEAIRVVNGNVQPDAAARFLTGADGNYYFDLLPFDDSNRNGIQDEGEVDFEYIIRATDPLGREFLNDGVTDANHLQNFKQEWRITKDWFVAPDREDPDPIEGIGQIKYDPETGAPVPFLINGFAVPMAAKNINFLISDEAPPNEIIVNGTVFADLNGNGRFDENGDDTPIGGITVYFDENRNNVYDAGELTVVTSTELETRGQYSLLIPADHTDTYAIGVVRPAPEANWAFTNPASGILNVFAGPGEELDNNDFFLDPPNDAFPPGGSTTPGNIFGVVFNDRNGNGIRNSGEEGVAGFQVYIDANDNQMLDDGELVSMTSSNGTFHFADVAPGLIQIDIVEGSAWAVVSPIAGFRTVQLGPGGTITNVQFALDNLADRDWGDLPDSYGTTSGNNGPSHVVVPGFRLGQRADGEVNGSPTTDNSQGDNALGIDDDGVEIISNNGELQPGINKFRVSVFGVGGLLTGWIDWNNSGTFEANEKVTWRDPLGNLVTEADLNPGVWTMDVIAPSVIAGGAPLAARFRWGESGLGPTGPAMIGEVEDYYLPNSVQFVLVGDYSGNGMVGPEDANIWRATFGSTADLRADGNGNGEIDAGDWVMIKQNWGQGSSSASAASASGGGSSSSKSTPNPSPPQNLAPAVMSWLFSDAPSLQNYLQQSGLMSHLQQNVVQRTIRNLSSGGQGGGQAGASSGPSGVVHSPTSPTSPSTVGGGVVATTNGTGSVSLANVLFASAGSVDTSSTSGAVRSGGSVAAAELSGDLLLIDQALADLSPDDVEDRMVAILGRDEDEETMHDDTLAAVFESEGEWWSL